MRTLVTSQLNYYKVKTEINLKLLVIKNCITSFGGVPSSFSHQLNQLSYEVKKSI